MRVGTQARTVRTDRCRGCDDKQQGQTASRSNARGPGPVQDGIIRNLTLDHLFDELQTSDLKRWVNVVCYKRGRSVSETAVPLSAVSKKELVDRKPT